MNKEFKDKFPNSFKYKDPPNLNEAKTWYKGIGQRIGENKKNISGLKMDNFSRKNRVTCK